MFLLVYGIKLLVVRMVLDDFKKERRGVDGIVLKFDIKM